MSNSIEVEIREQRIREVEAETRALQEQIDKHEDELQGWRDRLDDANKRDYPLRVKERDARITELERENNALRKMHAEALAFARMKQDQYDGLCTKIGQEAPEFDLGALIKGL